MKIVDAEKRIINKLVEKCRENIDEKELHLNEMIYTGSMIIKKHAIFVQ